LVLADLKTIRSMSVVKGGGTPWNLWRPRMPMMRPSWCPDASRSLWRILNQLLAASLASALPSLSRALVRSSANATWIVASGSRP